MLRAADVREHGWSPQLLIRLHHSGKLQRIARGLYGLPGAEVTEHQTLVEVCQRVPQAVVCLFGALQFHEIGTQMPHEVWIDCFKVRNKIGLDVALEALKDAWRGRKVTTAELSHFARINRVERVMQPYLELMAH